MSSDYENKSSGEIEAEVEQTRARVAETLEELKDRMSPTQLFDQAVGYLRTDAGSDMASNGAAFTRNAGAALRDNPIPTLLIGAGIAYLLFGGSKSPKVHDDDDVDDTLGSASYEAQGYGAPRGGSRVYRSYGDDRDVSRSIDEARESTIGVGTRAAGEASSAYGSAKDAVGSAAGSATRAYKDAKDAASGAYGTAADKASGLYGRASETAASAADRASSLYGTVADKASSAYDAATSTASDASARASDAAAYAREQARYARRRAEELSREGRSQVMNLVEEQPLVLGVLGLAIGAAIGAALPSTDVESRTFGETSDAVKRQAYGLVDEGMEKAKDVAGRVVGEAKEAASRVADEARSSASRIAEQTTAAANQVLQQTREAAGQVVEQTKAAAGQVLDQTKAAAGQVAGTAMDQAKDKGLNLTSPTDAVDALAAKTESVIDEAAEATKDAIRRI